jgi:hypothetical protein
MAEEWQEAAHLLPDELDLDEVEPGDIIFHDGHFCEVTAYISKKGQVIGIRYIKYEFWTA